MEARLEGDFGGTFPFEPRYLDVGGVRLHYLDEGPRDARPLLFLHGNPTWSYLWRRQVAALSQAGHRCIAFDHMGFGRSDKPPHLSAYSLRAHVDNALALIDELGLEESCSLRTTGAGRSVLGRSSSAATACARSS